MAVGRTPILRPRMPTPTNDDFTISSHRRRAEFQVPPDFETMPGGGTADNSNTYNVVVVASDDAPGVTGRKMELPQGQVTVTDEDEDGSISLSAQQPQVGVALTGTLTDQDDRVLKPIINATGPNIKWTWRAGPWTLNRRLGHRITGATADGQGDMATFRLRKSSASTSGRRSPTPTSMAMTRPPWRCRLTMSGRSPLEATPACVLRWANGHPRR